MTCDTENGMVEREEVEQYVPTDEEREARYQAELEKADQEDFDPERWDSMD